MSDHPIARPLAASLSNEAAMSGIRPSLVDLPGDILKEIVETVARLSVSNRGADNEICSLSMVNKLFYELAIPHIFRVIRISRLRHFSLDGLYTGLPPVPLKYTIYLGLDFPPDYSMKLEHLMLFASPKSYACRWIAAQLLATLHVARNAQVVSFQVPEDILYYLASHANALGKRFTSVVELHYYCHQLQETSLNSDIPELFPNLTTLVGFGIDTLRDIRMCYEVIIPFLSEVFNEHEHLKHLQLHHDWKTDLLARLARIGPRLETIAMSWTHYLYYNEYLWNCINSNVEGLQRVLEQNKGIKNITLPRYNNEDNAVEFRNILAMIRVHCPHIEMVAVDMDMDYELWRRSSNFQIGELVPKLRTTTTSYQRKSQAWMRYLEPVMPHQKLGVTSYGGVSVISINPILETEVVGRDPWASKLNVGANEDQYSTASDDSED
ncbi:hypothetical protein BFW01_g559 [Lasiodiplodia theobromae]|nr:hypothetical protein BFW01_g559 [Lasiodiplodia theobromae]